MFVSIEFVSANEDDTVVNVIVSTTHEVFCGQVRSITLPKSSCAFVSNLTIATQKVLSPDDAIIVSFKSCGCQCIDVVYTVMACGTFVRP